jgi:hypothetical protein
MGCLAYSGWGIVVLTNKVSRSPSALDVDSVHIVPLPQAPIVLDDGDLIREIA